MKPSGSVPALLGKGYRSGLVISIWATGFAMRAWGAARGNTSNALPSGGRCCGEQKTALGMRSSVAGKQGLCCGDVSGAVAISPYLTLKTDGTVWEYSFDSDYPSQVTRVSGLSGIVALASAATTTWRGRSMETCLRPSLSSSIAHRP